ncbi:MAG: pirin family protein [Halobacteriovoraceae bacterium]|nr:pirin family protein [Halobacteriovoraceae bacterium]
MQKLHYHSAESRGKANHGWLNSFHSFSFANYYDPKRMGFGTLRVINDDVIDPATGFGTHPHNDMEIISIPIHGALKHKDTMGNETIIRKGEVQAMSAGTGIFHSEYNASEVEKANFLQIWILPEKKGTKPNYSQKEFSSENRKGKLQLVVSPDGREGSVVVGQKAFFSLADLEKGSEITYEKYNKENGVYFFIIEGKGTVAGEEFKRRDGLGIENEDSFHIKTEQNSEILVMEVPLTV